MSSTITRNIIRAITMILLQVIVFKGLSLGTGIMSYVHIMVYPLVIILLPLSTPRMATLLISFGLGLIVDISYDSLGVHTSALLLMAFVRDIVLRIREPFGGYNVNQSPTLSNLGSSWFMAYASILLGTHLFMYFCVEAFTFVHFGDILLSTIFSFILSFIFVMLHQWIFKPKV